MTRTTPRSSPRPGLCDLYRTVQIQVRRLQPVNCDGLCFSSNVQFEGLDTWLNHPEGALIGTLKWSPVATTSNKDKLGKLKDIMEGMDVEPHAGRWVSS